MNRQELDLLREIINNPNENQRTMAENTGHSLGIVNRSLHQLKTQGFLDASGFPTEKARAFSSEHTPQNAIILAAGFASRMVPINLNTPKALMEVNGEPLIERQIRQLHEAGVFNIFVVVGYLKEQFDYLIDEYDVTLVVNKEYAIKNNLHSIKKVLEHISNSYIIPCDIWCRTNPFNKREFYSWYMVSDETDIDSSVRVNRKKELVHPEFGQPGNTMIGIAYLSSEDAGRVSERIQHLCDDHRFDEEFWESALMEKNKMSIEARIVSSEDVKEINTFEQLRDLDGNSDHLQHEAMLAIMETFGVRPDEITGISVLKKGMTNRSFRFFCHGKEYIMRIPGEGTEKLINRREEALVYQTLNGLNICDDMAFIDPESGYKITAMLPDARVCNPFCEDDLRLCMKKLREFHQRHFEVSHQFDLFGQIDFYESLWNGKESVYRDYKKTKSKVLELEPYIREHINTWCLSHIDSVPDNFIFSGNEVRLIDWEYAGMQDPHIDIAMFCIYAMYDRNQIDHLIDLYFDNDCSTEIRIKIYCYIAACGLLWSNWCEYKATLGVEFGEYSLRQYRYAKDYSRLAAIEMEKMENA